MDHKKILNVVDHTLLGVTATWEEIKTILDDAVKYETASACIPAAYVKEAAEYVNGETAICTVIGFPLGANTKDVKVFETVNACENGADEIDMVINIGWLKDKRYYTIVKEKFESEISKKFFNTDKLLKFLDEHYNNKWDHSRKIWTIYVFLVWYEIYFEEQ